MNGINIGGANYFVKMSFNWYEKMRTYDWMGDIFLLDFMF